MKIQSIRVHKIELPYKGVGRFWTNRVPPKALDSTVVAIETDDGIVGYGETCPIDAIYLEGFAETARAAIARIAPRLIGEDPRGLGRINELMDLMVVGHPHAKSPIDIACWDIFGQSVGLPLHMLLGGRFSEKVPLVTIVPFGTAAEMVRSVKELRAQGFRVFQMKVGSGVSEDVARVRAVADEVEGDERIIVDANRAWTTEDALRILRKLDDVDCVIEQPCSSYESCLVVRRHSRHPLMLDECMNGVGDVVRAFGDGALDGLVIKLSHAGGLTRASELRNLCHRLGIQMRIEDTAGCEFTMAATAHLAQATPPDNLIGAYPFVNKGFSAAQGGPEIAGGHVRVSDRPGLGLAPELAVLGQPLMSFPAT